MTYKEFYDTVVYAMFNGEAEELDAMRNLNLEWFVECTSDIKDTLEKYTLFGVS